METRVYTSSLILEIIIRLWNMDKRNTKNNELNIIKFETKLENRITSVYGSTFNVGSTNIVYSFLICKCIDNF